MLESPVMSEPRKGRPPKRYQVDAASSVGSESLQAADEEESVVSGDLESGDFDDEDVFGLDMTNKPLTELLRVSTRASSSHTSLAPRPPVCSFPFPVLYVIILLQSG